MGFEELSDDDLTGWLADWLANVSGTTDFTADDDAVTAGKITVSIQGDLVRLELSEATTTTPPDRLSRAIEQGYVEAYREALRQAGMVFDRLKHDSAGNPAVVRRIRKVREEYSGRDGLRRMLRRQQVGPESSWNPATDSLLRRR